MRHLTERRKMMEDSGYKNSMTILQKENFRIREWSEDIKKSPFCFRQNISCREVCGNQERTVGFLKNLVISRKIADIELEILRGLSLYGYLGGYMLRQYLLLCKFGFPEREAFRKRMRWMIENGLVRQYEFISGEKGSSFVYSLGFAGEKFLKMVHGRNIDDTVALKPEKILNKLVCNQFFINLQLQYGGVVNDCIIDDGSCVGRFVLTLPVGGDVNVCVFAVRNSKTYKNYFLKHLRKIKKEQNGMRQYAIFVICETEEQAMNCAKIKGGDASISGIDTFYLLDTFGVSDDVLGKLIEILPGDNYTEKRMFSLAM